MAEGEQLGSNLLRVGSSSPASRSGLVRSQIANIGQISSKPQDELADCKCSVVR
jgi:hypothetical protein